MRQPRRCCWARSWASAIAVLLGVGFYRGASRVNLRTFFRWTGIALIFIAAGLLSKAVHEFVEIGWITVGTQTLFDASATLPHAAVDGVPGGIALLAGQFLRALFGYTSQPEVITFVVWADLRRQRTGPVPAAVQGRGTRDQAQPRHQLGVLSMTAEERASVRVSGTAGPA